MWNPFSKVYTEKFDGKPVNFYFEVEYPKDKLLRLSKVIILNMKKWRLAKFFPCFEVHFTADKKNKIAFVPPEDCVHGRANIHICVPKIFHYINWEKKRNNRTSTIELTGLFEHELTHPLMDGINDHYKKLYELAKKNSGKEIELDVHEIESQLHEQGIKFSLFRDTKSYQVWKNLQESFYQLHGESIAEYNKHIVGLKKGFGYNEISNHYLSASKYAHNVDELFNQWISQKTEGEPDELVKSLRMMRYYIGIHVAQVVLTGLNEKEQMKIYKMHPKKYLAFYEKKCGLISLQPLVAENNNSVVLSRRQMVRHLGNHAINLFKSGKRAA